ncbi:hypothetical protein [Xylophilus ampelinus]|uniref:hypothetical protein n=1 Tax=Xylophilus ampelinus TaxID=54067 RepID=UPI001F463514|nr:hypothetical protein [Xylophilus ampelinus]MCS4511129.1 hypothetical protein [Xylophilus ampelinus]
MLLAIGSQRGVDAANLRDGDDRHDDQDGQEQAESNGKAFAHGQVCGFHFEQFDCEK